MLQGSNPCYLRLLILTSNGQIKPNQAQGSQPSPWLTEAPIGKALRASYDSIQQEPIPERLQMLMAELRKKEQQKTK